MEFNTPTELQNKFIDIRYCPLSNFDNNLTKWVHHISKLYYCIYSAYKTGSDRTYQKYFCTFGGIKNSTGTMKGQTDCPSFVSFSIQEGFVSYSQGNFLHNHEVSKEFTLAARSCCTADELERMNYWSTSRKNQIYTEFNQFTQPFL